MSSHAHSLNDSSDEEYAVKLLENMLKMYSPSGQEAELASYLKGELSSLGFKEVSVDSVGNVFGEAGRGRPQILFIGHIDTVSPFLPVKKSEGRLYGRGAVDAKSPMAAMIVAASRWIKSHDHGTVRVCCLVDEEGGGKGIKNLIEGSPEADYAIFGEPSGLRNVTVGYRGHIGVKLSVETEPVHISVGRKEFNAVELAIDLWEKIREKLSETKRSEKGEFHKVTSSIAGIEGGDGGNVTPRKCDLYVDIRVPPEVRCEDLTETLKRIVSKFNEENAKASVSMNVRFKVNPVLISKSSPVVRALTRSILKTLGGPVKFIKKLGTGDMNLLVSSLGIPAATYGPGDPKLSHTLNEYVEVEDYLNSIRVYHNAIFELCSMYRKG